MAEQSRAEIEFFPEWAARIKQMLSGQDRGRDDAPPMHVPKALVIANPEHYIPHFISLGPCHYHSSRLEVFPEGGLEHDEVAKMSITEVYKVKSAAALSNRINQNGRSFGDMFALIKSMRQQFEHFYKLQIAEGMYSENFSLMMMLDSLFLLDFLASRDRGEYSVRINRDILKLENQIPLFLLKEIFVEFELSRVLHLEDGIKPLLLSAYKKLSPFDVSFNIPGVVPDVEGQPHLLHWIHSIVSGFLQIKVGSRPPTLLQRICDSLDRLYGIFFCFTKEDALPIKAYNAWELAKVGINFRSFSRPPHTIRFEKWSRTVYLPRMTISSVQTEILLRNLHALEFIDQAGDNTVTSFIQLMDCFIDTPDDVQVLRKAHVISRKTMLNDKDITDMWESMRRPFFLHHGGRPGDLKCALDEVLKAKYYKMKIRGFFSELFHYYYQHYFSKPWSFITLLFATFILAMNMVQAYCAFGLCNSTNPKL